MELNEYGRIFRRRWVLILVSTLVGLLLAGIASGLADRTYEAKADLFIRADSEASSSFENSQFVLQRVKSYPDLVNSPQVLTPVLQELDSSMTLAEIREKVSASNPPETVYVNVTASAGTAEEAAALANSVASNLRDVIRQLEGGDTTRNAAVEAFVTTPADAPTSASTPNTVLNLAMGLLVGLTAGLIAAVVLGAGHRRIRSSGDLPRSVDVEVLGAVAGGASRSSGVLAQETALQYRELMTSLLIKRGGQLPKLLMVTSVGQRNDAQEAFGKQFAGLIGDSGALTCVIDATRPKVRSDGADAELGFSDVLVGEATLNDVLTATDAGTYRIPIGTSSDRISRSRAARQGASTLKELDDAFDVTLVKTSYDSHPLTTWTVAPVAEAVLVLVSWGTPAADLEDSVRELQAVGVEPLGLVLLGGPRRSGGRASGRAHLKVRTAGRG
ncbi:Wzz/FepE/Etk N-terminal domain-containing protein [Arthrobacter sp. MDT1-48-3]